MNKFEQQLGHQWGPEHKFRCRFCHHEFKQGNTPCLDIAKIVPKPCPSCGVPLSIYEIEQYHRDLDGRWLSFMKEI